MRQILDLLRSTHLHAYVRMAPLQRLPLCASTAPKVLHAWTTPCIFPTAHFAATIPAISTWFNASSSPPDLNIDFFTKTLNSSRLNNPVTVESTAPGHFERIQIPFSLFLHYLSLPTKPDNLPNLYLAQTPLLEEFPELKTSFEPEPAFVRAGKGEVYSPNVWMGRSETVNTPLHKDPNSNLFVQLAGKKSLRTFSPDTGRRIFEQLGYTVDRFRGEDMMVGDVKERVERAVWDEEQEGGMEAEVGVGDGVYIPQGWWHAIRGVGVGVNASVNWWFR